MFKKFFILFITLLSVFTFSCKKDADNNNKTAIVGHWKYTNSTVDSLINGKWTTPVTAYDSTVIDNFAESLRFTATDTVYYTYYGITTWSNYKVEGNQLILIGSTTADTLTIHSLNNTLLQIGKQTNSDSYWVNFTRY